MRINNNLMAMNAYRQLGITNNAAAKAVEKLSSGYRINRAGDDAAGLAISEKMRGQIRGLNMAAKNAQDGISLIQTAEGALQETHDILQKMRELAVQAANDTNIGVDRSEIQKEINELIDEIDRIAKDTEFNQQKLLDGTFEDKVFHIGANAGQSIKLSINSMNSGAATGGTPATPASNFEDYKVTVDGQNFTVNGEYTGTEDVTVTLKAISDGGSGYKWVYSIDDGDFQDFDSDRKATINGVTITAPTEAPTEATESGNEGEIVLKAAVAGTGDGGGLGVGGLKVDNPTKESTGGIMTSTDASAAITTIQKAIELVSAERAKLGAYQNRLEHTIKNLDTSAENLQAAESRIRDVDYAEAA